MSLTTCTMITYISADLNKQITLEEIRDHLLKLKTKKGAGLMKYQMKC